MVESSSLVLVHAATLCGRANLLKYLFQHLQVMLHQNLLPVLCIVRAFDALSIDIHGIMGLPDPASPIEVEQHEIFPVISQEEVSITKIAMNVLVFV